jgi:hypothetical protein
VTGASPSGPSPVGYLHPDYPASLAEFGAPRRLPRSGGWVLVRDIPGAVDCRDAVGCYPFLVCGDWSGLCADVEELASEVVSLAAVTDPFGACEPEQLGRCFDSVRRFKDHHVVDLRAMRGDAPSRHHRRKARKALGQLRVEAAAEPARYAEEWLGFYSTLVERRGLQGLRGFSTTAVRRQLEVPGALLLRALRDGEGVAAHLWYLQGRVGYSHLQASSPEGYRCDAAYALYGSAVDTLAARVDWLALGAAPGRADDRLHGLNFFKSGWATGTRPVHLCTRVFDARRYADLAREAGTADSEYFPAYRAGEVG